MTLIFIFIRVFIFLGSCRRIHFTPNNRFYTLFLCFLVKINYTKHYSMVCYCQGVHTYFFCMSNKVTYSCRPIQKTIFCMYVKMCKCHRLYPYISLPATCILIIFVLPSIPAGSPAVIIKISFFLIFSLFYNSSIYFTNKSLFLSSYSTTILSTPQQRASLLATSSFEVAAKIGAFGLNLEIIIGVPPEAVGARMALAFKP